MTQTVKVVVKNPRWESRHLYANGWNGPEYEEYIGQIFEEPWMGPERFGLTSSDPRFPLRVLSRTNVCSIDGVTIEPPKFQDHVVKQYTNSRGTKYLVTKRGASITCSCIGFTYRRSCKHVKMFDEL